MNKRFVLILVACIVIFGGLLAFSKRDNKSTANNGNNGDSSATLSDHKQGSGPVKLIEYGDFACPACAQYYPIVKQVKQQYKDDITFQFRHYPLTEIHQNALISARAAEAAGMQNKFFEMHDMLYENQSQWDQSTNPSQFFEQYAQQLNLDVNKFKEDMKSEQVNKVVQADRAEARKLGYSSTPTFEINGKKIDSANLRSVEDFGKAIEDAKKSGN